MEERGVTQDLNNRDSFYHICLKMMIRESIQLQVKNYKNISQITFAIYSNIQLYPLYILLSLYISFFDWLKELAAFC